MAILAKIKGIGENAKLIEPYADGDTWRSCRGWVLDLFRGDMNEAELLAERLRDLAGIHACHGPRGCWVSTASHQGIEVAVEGDTEAESSDLALLALAERILRRRGIPDREEEPQGFDLEGKTKVKTPSS